jgi:hypothetical protein
VGCVLLLQLQGRAVGLQACADVGDGVEGAQDASEWAMGHHGDGFVHVLLQSCHGLLDGRRLFAGHGHPVACAPGIVGMQAGFAARQWVHLDKKNPVSLFAGLFECPVKDNAVGRAVKFVTNLVGPQRVRQDLEFVQTSFSGAFGVRAVLCLQVFEGQLCAPDLLGIQAEQFQWSICPSLHLFRNSENFLKIYSDQQIKKRFVKCCDKKMRY